MEGNEHAHAPGHPHSPDHRQGHGHTHVEDEHRHRSAGARLKRLRHGLAHAVAPHSHEAADKVDTAMESSREGMRTLWISSPFWVRPPPCRH